MISYPQVKLNLGLRVLRRRSDGYHDIESLMIPFNGFRDTLEIVPSGEFSIRVSLPDGSPAPWNAETDLTAKAWRLLRDEFRIGPVRIDLLKRAPVGAGLGGGSSDGAYALKMLSEIFSLGLSDGALEERAAMLGSDCPFFVRERPCICRGRGEIMEPFGIDLSPYRIEVVTPGVAVSTREAYCGIVPCDEGKPLEDVLSLPVRQWKSLLVNDFEKTVFGAHPQLREIKQDFYDRGAVYASMSGSGSAVYGIFEK